MTDMTFETPIFGQDSSVGIAMGYGADGWDLIPRRGKRFFSI
jgi:hypothetical protein